jgi:LEA14-like dessication related protein
MKIRLLIPSIALMAVIFTSCKKIKEPDYRGYRDLKISNQGNNKGQLSLILDYFNPNNKAVKLKEAEGDVFIDGQLLGHFIVDSLIKINRLSDFSVPVKVSVIMDMLAKQSMKALLNPRVLLKIDGMARVGNGAFFFNVPIKYEKETDLKF